LTPVLAGMLLGASGCAIGPLLSGVQVTPNAISPNADGVDDVTHINYRISRPADVSIYFIDSAGQKHYFRNKQRRSPGAYDVYWGGVINDPQVQPVKGGQELVLSQVLPDGTYTWVIEADDLNGGTQNAEGQIVLQGADTQLPELTNFTVVPQKFSPNQDGTRGNRVSVSYYLTKKVERIEVYLEPAGLPPGKQGLKYPIPQQESVSTVESGDAGYHGYTYDGGVDLNAEPPPDGDYVVKAEAQDKVGNTTQVSTTLTISEGGKPRAEISGGEINWQGEMNRGVSLMLGQTLCFTATVTNIGPVPIRTSGPWPGQVYTFTQNFNTLAQLENQASWGQQAGVYRFGINYDTTGVDFPFRWAIGRQQDLEKRVVDNTEQYYLLPGHRGLVSGCIRFDEKPPVGTQFWWGGLIHEQVAVENDQVERITVDVGAP
jgi:hypothetical protein